MSKKLLLNALIVNEGRCQHGYVYVKDEFIALTGEGDPEDSLLNSIDPQDIYDLKRSLLLPGIIDDQVHFRDPGLTHKGDICSESRAAVAGGVTSFMDMPNTKPATTDFDRWQAKMDRAAEVSHANYAFFPGATNDNIDFLRNIDYTRIPGVKVFLGSSTGNMLVDSDDALDRIFSLPCLIAVHSEDEEIINANKKIYSEKYPDGVPVSCHSIIRSEQACFVSTRRAAERALRLGTRLHILHLSTGKEIQLLRQGNISSEVCVHHLWFTDKDYDRLGTRIKWNPAVKTAADRDALRAAVNEGKIDIVATDHAPHLLSEKDGDALNAASGGPLIQHSLLMMLEMVRQGIFSYEKTVEMMCHNPARLYGIDRRGFIRSGYYADLVVVDPEKTYKVTQGNILSKCGWSPLEGERFSHKITHTFVNGTEAFRNLSDDECDTGILTDERRVHPLRFNLRDNTAEDNTLR